MKIAVQSEDFSVQAEVDALRERSRQTGAIVSFTGLVRELEGDENIRALELEHYPGMTEKSLQDIAGQAAARWPLIDGTIIHRIGRLDVTEQIVLVVVSSAHRQAAFDACGFIMDYLKTRAPFWKKVHYREGEAWVDAKDADQQASKRWQ